VHTKQSATMALDESAMTDCWRGCASAVASTSSAKALALVLQALIDAEATEAIGAGRYQRSTSRTTTATAPGLGCCRPRPALWTSRPQAARGSFFPALLEPRRRIDRALLAVVMEA
jgi:putative transposase